MATTVGRVFFGLNVARSLTAGHTTHSLAGILHATLPRPGWAAASRRLSQSSALLATPATWDYASRRLCPVAGVVSAKKKGKKEKKEVPTKLVVREGAVPWYGIGSSKV
ncbi:hypothetical protein LTR37_001554 [Vermiconidia calcicola]|uniref:Uncharacterized protein n=1 Tax=Vermiconidia calcicola TaxID=1690605 RepID=A0ACC3NVL9_9PEZI|nr:hypothetical protein LTR37_001554 [Vermiconidia calcicola]